MPNIPETFEEARARIAAQPAQVVVPVPKINLDLTLPGIITRLQALAQQAHQRGELQPDVAHQLITAGDNLKAALSRVETKVLLRHVQAGLIRPLIK